MTDDDPTGILTVAMGRMETARYMAGRLRGDPPKLGVPGVEDQDQAVDLATVAEVLDHLADFIGVLAAHVQCGQEGDG